MKLKKQVKWISAEDFQVANPLTAEIKEIYAVQTKLGEDNILILDIKNLLAERQMSIWGDNLNKLVGKFGEETINWVGHQISITRTVNVQGKNRNDISI